ncbi:lytic murein transglycosylase B [Xylella taiwanensis]|uniref:Murein transglycosylase n=1 Tax=Xylella taiwanensis TaxID=1444770 RepID=Z9JF70_9GAMM|nr:lytic murein transglycosylase B [Xylella taiwanensis]AXI83682.1 murein transglycosylase [Xylella taiwanensis]EWS77010.1 murein transglycosylase [Xylella taiwanensis]MCD8456770.1 lytic murein transglycosylase B [Xylella taiwanensis]MCD8459180.1 lytic murein transglycosylase B [Xylella taiwanensis]MCD8461928.1 lytic murein transglycosylase B [Xylella taiwanensis]
MIKRLITSILTLGLVACASQPSSKRPASPTPTEPTKTTEPPKVTEPPLDLSPVPFEIARTNFIRDTATKYGLDPRWIEATLAQAQIKDGILAAMSRPAEQVKPWSEYRLMFVNQQRIDSGRKFLASHKMQLKRVEAATGVPMELIVAIMGVETDYGTSRDKYRVLDALYTLAFRYPRSGDPNKLKREVQRELFFRDELGQLFALGKEEGLDVTTLMGSYAGAMGMGQFMPSNYRDYAVDGDGDGKRDLFTNKEDVFASIANYFVKEKGGWVRGGLIAVPATLTPGYQEFTPPDWIPRYTLTELAARGYHANAPVTDGTTATPISLDGTTGKQYWLCFQNYYAITRYNPSKMYAMAVFQLSEAIAGRALPKT